MRSGKKWGNVKAAIALLFAHYNSYGVRSSLRVTPAKEAGLTDHALDTADLL
jgi:hypothetical protein